VVYGVLAVTPSVESLENELWTEVRTMIAVTGVLLVTLLGLTHVILLVGLRPVRALADSATRLGHGDLTARMPETKLAEMRPTVRAFNSMAASLEQALHEARTRQTRLESLVEISSELSRMQPLDSLLGRIAEACGRLVKTDWVGFRLVDGDELVVAGTLEGGTEMPVRRRLKIGESLAGQVAATGRPLLLRDPASHPSMLPEHAQAMRRLGYHGMLTVPARVGDRVVGVLSFLTRREEGFSTEDLAIATAFASHAAVALENSRLLHESRRAYDELAQTQGQLEQAQKMDAIGRLAGGVAHDFNNLLTVILGRTDILLTQIKTEDPLRRGIALIQRTAGRAAELTKQLLAFSRKQVLEAVVLDLGVVTTDMKEMLARLIGEDIALVTNLAATLGHVKADRGQIEQVVMNLAINARDAMPQGGQLVVETANADLDDEYVRRNVGSRPGPHVMLAVSDSGVGIPRELQRHIFEPFFTTKEQGKGTGLGLSTVYGIVKQSGGFIFADNVMGQDRKVKGARFTIYLPVYQATEEELQRADTVEVKTEWSGGGRVLLVEDEDMVRAVAERALTRQGYSVVTAADGDEGLEAVRQNPDFDLVVSDVVMPSMDGPAMAREIRQLIPTMPVLFMSGYAEEQLRREIDMEGMHFIAKPFSVAQIADKVGDVLRTTRR